MRFDIITIFPDLFKGFLSESLLARAQKPAPKGRGLASGGKPLLEIKTHNLRKWTSDRHKTVDDRPYGGGAGMVLKIQPIYEAVESLKSKIKNQKSKFRSRIILLSAKGKTLTQKDARRLAKYDQIIFICGRYEGVDERVSKYVADEEMSIGNYILFGGEVAAMVVIEAVARLISGVIAKSESVKNESFSDKEAKSKEYPQYTRPEIFIPTTNDQRPTTNKGSKESLVASRKLLVAKEWKVPKILLSGDHRKINEWREKQSKFASKK